MAIDQGWRRRKARHLLELLAVQPDRSLHREQTIDVLWPDQAPSSGANNLHKAVHHIRAELAAHGIAGDVLTLSPDTVSLSSEVQLDIDAFRSAAAARKADRPELYDAALALYSGDLLQAERYEDWTEPLRSALRSLRDDLLLEVAALREKAGELESAAERLRQLVHVDPTREEAQRALMRVYAHSGQRDRALRQYQECREALRRDLAVDPSAETEALQEAILSDAPRTGVSSTSDSFAAALPGELLSPPVHYARTVDGADIAYWTIGRGPLLINMRTLPHNHIQLEWQFPEWRRWHQRLARYHRVVAYDHRGAGLSTCEDPQYNLDTLVCDLEAIVHSTGERKVALLAEFHSGPPAIAYAVQHPERVSHLVLWCSHPRGSGFMDVPQVQAMREVVLRDFDLYAQSAASAMVGWSRNDAEARYAEFIRQATPPENVLRFITSIAETDVTELLGRVRVPTLVIHYPEAPWINIEMSRELARSIPGARLLLMEGPSPVPLAVDQEAAAAAIEEFLVHEAVESEPERLSVAPQVPAITAGASPAPPVRYALASDGVRIAYSVHGSGPALLVLPTGPHSHLLTEWSVAEYRAFYEALAEDFTVTRFDGRGCGLSDREIDGYSLEAVVSDIEAVSDAACPARLALMVQNAGGPQAVAYAARHPERVSHLVVFCGFANGKVFYSSSGVRAIIQLMRTDWETYAMNMPYSLLGYAGGSFAHGISQVVRDGSCPENAAKYIEWNATVDTSYLLAGLMMPALIMYRRDTPAFFNQNLPKEMAAAIPNAELCVLEGSSAAPHDQDTNSVLAAIRDFVRANPDDVSARKPRREHLRLVEDVS